MKFIIDHDFHIHSTLSSCCHDPELTPEAILKYAEESGLKSICLTNHYWDEAVEGVSSWYSRQNTPHVKRALPLPSRDGIDYIFGCETEMRQDLALGILAERFSEFDFVVIPTTHLHMDGFTYPKDFVDTPENRAELWVERLDHLLALDLPFHKIGIAHLACGLINQNSDGEYLRTLELIPEQKMTELFKRAAALGCGIEINRADMTFSHGGVDTVLRPFRIAKACGCKFYLGSDAHHRDDLYVSREIFERAVDLLSLTERDKFILE